MAWQRGDRTPAVAGSGSDTDLGWRRSSGVRVRVPSTSIEEPSDETGAAVEAEKAAHSMRETREVEREKSDEGPDGGHHRV